MITEELNYTELRRVFNDESSQTPATQRFNRLLTENAINFEVCLSREDNHLYMYTHFFNLPLFKSRYTCTDGSWISSQTKLLPLYKVLKTFSSDIEHGKFESSTKLELEFVYDKLFDVKLELLDTEEVKIQFAYYYNTRRFSSHGFKLGDGYLEVYSEGLRDIVHFKYSVEEIVSLNDFSHSTMIELKTKIKDNLEKMGYTI